MRYDENKMTPMEINSELERYEVEERLKNLVKEGNAFWGEMFEVLDEVILRLEKDEKIRIEAEEALCWAQYKHQNNIIEQKLLQKDIEAFEEMEKMWKDLRQEEKIEFEIAIQLLKNWEIPVKEEDVEMEIEECLKEDAENKSKKKKDPFVEIIESKNPRNGTSYRRKQERRVKRETIQKAIAADKDASHRSKSEMRKRRKNIKPEFLEKYPGESNSHRIFRQYNWEYSSQSARAGRLRKAAEKLVPELNEFSQKHLEEVWEKKAEAREAQQAAKLAEKEAAKQTA